jgi:hypothetical protein
VQQRLLRGDLAPLERAQDHRQRADQLRHRARVELAAVGVRQEIGLVQQAVLLDVLDERRLVAMAVVAVVDVVVGPGDPPQPHDLAHRRDALGARLDAVEAVGAVVDAVRVLGEVLEALLLAAVARVADEAVGLGERGRADEQRVDLHGQAVAHAGAALDARHRLRDVDHRLRRDDVLALGRVAVGQQPRGDALDLLPVDRVHVDDQVLDHRHVPHRLDRDDDGLLLALVGRVPAQAVRGLGRLLEVRVAGQRGLAVDAHAAGAADRGAAGAADADRAVLAVLGLEDAVEHRAVPVEVDCELLPVGRPARLG